MSDLGNKEIMAENIRRLMEEKRVTRSDVCKAIGVKYTTLTDWVKGKTYPRIDKIEKLALYFGVSKSDLVERYTGAQPSSRKYFRVPVLGSVHAGYAHDLIQEPVLDYEDLSADEFRDDEKEYFCLRIRGDCMTPRICEGDVVVVHKQPDAESGSIVVVAVNAEEGFCKRLRKYPDSQSIALISLNPAYPPRIFSVEEIRSLPVTIVGVVVELRAKMI